MNQADLVARFCDRPQNFAWFLGAGASRTAGLPTATDIIWDLKRRYYCSEENLDIAGQDLQNNAVKDRIQSYFDSRGFPSLWDDDEYTVYFERIFGADRERQRRYIRSILSEEHLSLSVGNRVLGAILVAGLARVVFTTNFDTVVEKAVAEMGQQPLAPYHLEGAGAANAALNNEEFPLYCKLHGDFRYDSLKNLSPDLEHQNDELSSCLVNAGNRFGFVVSGYSGRDESVMRLFERVLKSPNPFPHGLYWTAMKGSTVPTAVVRLLDQAQSQGVEAAIVESQTFDAFMLHVWRNIQNRPPALDAKVRKSRLASVDIPLPPPGRGKPLIRLSGLPILSLPDRCHSLTFSTPMKWDELRKVMFDSRGGLVLAKGSTVFVWGTKHQVLLAFGGNIESIAEASVPSDLRTPENYPMKSLILRALSVSLARNRPLLTRTQRHAAYLIADPHAAVRSDLAPLAAMVGGTGGTVSGLFTTPTAEHPEIEQVEWAEALRISVDQRHGRLWLVVQPDFWTWPARARRDAQDFMADRRRDRLNGKYNQLLDAWLSVVLGDHQRGAEIQLSPFDSGDDVENPRFVLGSRTAFTRRR